ncbi:MAG: hypothetical protein COB49_09520 [Alphaproteobacteria bacterium]|nr:MAG: hypothetical protein COB49_09520 [Alphaproteobacteria bacterium]
MPADPARISQITQAARTSKSEDGTVKVLSLGARDREITSALYEQLDAEAENLRQFNLMKVARDIYQVQLSGQNGVYRVGQTRTIKYPRFGLTAGRDFMIKGVSEQFGTGLTILTLWG